MSRPAEYSSLRLAYQVMDFTHSLFFLFSLSFSLSLSNFLSLSHSISLSFAPPPPNVVPFKVGSEEGKGREWGGQGKL